MSKTKVRTAAPLYDFPARKPVSWNEYVASAYFRQDCERAEGALNFDDLGFYHFSSPIPFINYWVSKEGDDRVILCEIIHPKMAPAHAVPGNMFRDKFPLALNAYLYIVIE